jgi:hypothetical protein
VVEPLHQNQNGGDNLKIVGILFALALVVSLVLVPVTVLAQADQGVGGLAKCEQDPWPKWWDNPVSHDLYLMNWGRTPIQAMSRLAGLCGPMTLCRNVGTTIPDPGKSKIYPAPNSCYGGCPSCRTVEQGATATCDDPLACTASENAVSCPATGQPTEGYTCPSTPVFSDKLPTCAGGWGISLAFANKSWAGADISDKPMFNNTTSLAHFGTSACTGGNSGGDWGVTGAPHTECCALTWALQDNCFSGECGGK